MKKLYRVTIKMMVVADDYIYAKDEVKYAISCVDADACDVEIEEATECLPGWKDAFPFGDNDDGVTCGEIVKNEGRKR